MFLASWKPKTMVFTVFFASDSKNHGIYHVFWPGPSKNTGIYAHVARIFFFMPKAQIQKHSKLHYFRAWRAAKKQQKIRPKVSKMTSRTHLQILAPFFPTPDPQKRVNPSRVKDFLAARTQVEGYFYKPVETGKVPNVTSEILEK